MIPKEFYNNGLFCSEIEGKITDESNLFYGVALKLFEKEKIEDDILDIRPNIHNLDFDSFDILTKNSCYTANVSFDDESFLLNNESEFLKNNSHDMLPEYVGCGKLKVGENLGYLIFKSDKGVSLYDVGSSFVFLSRFRFLQCLNILKTFKSNISFVDHADFIFKHFDIASSIPQIAESSIYKIHKKDQIQKITEPIREYFYSSLDLNILNGDDFCHGNLNIDNISTNGDLFKFHDFHCGFSGNGFLDLCFMSLNFSYDNYMFTCLIKDYCEINGLDYNNSKPIFRSCLLAASCVFMYKRFNELIIEQCLFENKREDKVTSILYSLDNAQWCFKRLPFYESIKRDFQKIYQSPSMILD
jgi:hypothetical protein